MYDKEYFEINCFIVDVIIERVDMKYYVDMSYNMIKWCVWFFVVGNVVLVVGLCCEKMRDRF